MIASLHGRIVARGSGHVVLEVGGVGYRVFVARQPEGELVRLHVHHAVREDVEQLFGFASAEELALFELLISVSGVGPKAGVALLSVSRPGEVAGAIAAGDAASLARAPGVGKKTAERIIVDLRSKLGAVTGVTLATAGAEEDEVAAALVALGFTAREADAAVAGSAASRSAPSEERLAAALRHAAAGRSGAGRRSGPR